MFIARHNGGIMEVVGVDLWTRSPPSHRDVSNCAALQPTATSTNLEAAKTRLDTRHCGYAQLHSPCGDIIACVALHRITWSCLECPRCDTRRQPYARRYPDPACATLPISHPPPFTVEASRLASPLQCAFRRLSRDLAVIFNPGYNP